MKDVLRANAQALHSLGRGSVQAANFEAFWNTVLQRGGWWDLRARGMAQLSTAPQAPTERQAPSFEGPTGTDTFYLLPFSSGSLTDGKGANLPWLQATPDPLATAAWQTWAEINARTADEMDIKEGDELELQSPAGSIKVLAYPNPAAAPGVIGVPTGQGHTHYGDFEIGPDLSRSLVGKDRGANVFSVLASGKKVDGTGALAWAATRVKVQKTGEFRRLTKLEGAVLATPPGEFDIVPVIQPEY
jgi:hypothetical protein